MKMASQEIHSFIHYLYSISCSLLDNHIVPQADIKERTFFSATTGAKEAEEPSIMRPYKSDELPPRAYANGS